MPKPSEVEPESPEREDGGEEDSGFDLARLRQLAGFFLRSARRHLALAVITTAILAAIAVATALLTPRTYTADVRILAQRNLVLPALGNPRRAVPTDADNPTRGVADTIMKRDNTIALVKQMNLIDRWDAARPPALRLKDALMTKIYGPMDDEQKLRSLVGMLETRLVVQTDADSVTISVEWPNAQIAYEIVTLVQKNFLEARYDAEIAVISEAIAILEGRAKTEADNVDAALDVLMKIEQQRRSGVNPAAPTGGVTPSTELQLQGTARAPSPAPPPSPPATTRPAAAAPPPIDPTLTEALVEKRRQIKLLEDEQQRRVADAQAKLADAQVSLGPLHPTVLDLKLKVDAAGQPTPELLAKKDQERQLAQLVANATPPPPGADSDPGAQALRPPRPTAPRSTAPSQNDVGLRMLLAQRDDAPTSYARQRLAGAQYEYNELLNRIDSAKIELDVARASFKYRYSVVRPAQVPGKPKKPNVPLLLVGGMLGALLVGILVCGIRDLRAGKFLEVWQVERRLKIPVLGEVNRYS